MQNIDEVYILFKTHLDVGFTDFAANVVDKYMTRFIPQVLQMNDSRFKWMTGSWLIHEYLERADKEGRAKMEKAILEDRIAWHGLPFTTHTESMDLPLFEYGLSISKDLDKRFGKNTIAAKMTDIPCHTRAMVTPLASAGISFLHLGKNPFCTAPEVPALFRWVNDDGAEIIVMYEMEYGSCTELSGTGKAVYFAHSYDNLGPPSQESLDRLYQDLRGRFPEAKLTPADLNTVAAAAEKIKHTLPVVTAELGDTWIHGIGSDPRKLSGYRGLLRYRCNLPEESADAINRFLLMVPEHTWGLDEKKYLHDFYGFIRTEFEQKRKTAPYRIMERSWREQRAYVTCAADSLSGNEHVAARRILRECKRVKTQENGCRKAAPGELIQIGDARVCFDSAGAVEYLASGGKTLSDKEHPWLKPMYQVFGKADYDRFLEQYVTERPMPWWAIEDLSKTGIDLAAEQGFSAFPVLQDVLVKDNTVIARMEFNGDAYKLFGAPQEMETSITLREDGTVAVDIAWWGKPATRVAEAMWIGVCPLEKPILIHKLGQWIDPMTVIENGNRHLHGVDFGVKAGEITIQTLDAGLVAPGKPSLLDFNNEQPDLREGLWFNLYNNIWGTNFPMWYSEDARFRFVINPSAT